MSLRDLFYAAAITAAILFVHNADYEDAVKMDKIRAERDAAVRARLSINTCKARNFFVHREIRGTMLTSSDGGPAELYCDAVFRRAPKKAHS